MCVLGKWKQDALGFNDGTSSEWKMVCRFWRDCGTPPPSRRRRVPDSFLFFSEARRASAGNVRYVRVRVIGSRFQPFHYSPRFRLDDRRHRCESHAYSPQSDVERVTEWPNGISLFDAISVCVVIRHNGIQGCQEEKGRRRRKCKPSLLLCMYYGTQSIVEMSV